MNLFGEEYEAPVCEQSCSETPKGKKKNTSNTTKTDKITDETALEIREVRVKIYNDFFDYSAPEDKEKPTIGDIRQWLVGQGYSELTKDRTTFTWITPEEGDKFLVAGVKFEKMG